MNDKQAIDAELAEISQRTGQLVFGILWAADRPFLVVQSDPDDAGALVAP